MSTCVDPRVDPHVAAGAGPRDCAAQAADAARAAAQAERRRLARELHDSVSQTLLGLQWTAQAAAELWETQPVQARAALDTVRQLATGATVEMRALLVDLHDAVLEQRGLGAALEAYGAVVQQRSGLPVELRVGEAGRDACAGPPQPGARLPQAHEEALYYVAREALANVVKHARATRATVTLTRGTTVRLCVEDDGVGLGAAAAAFTYGLRGMRERVAALGGWLLLENRPGGGARVVAELPVPATAPCWTSLDADVYWHRRKGDSSMSHHYTGPDFTFPRGDARVDLTDLYVFPKPGDRGKSIVIMDVHPSFGFNPPGPTTTEPFAPEALYELRVDTNGDLIADIAYRVRFSPSGDGGMTATVRRMEGPAAAGMGEDGEIIVQEAPVSMGREARVTEAGAYRFFAGWRSDPFFFDAAGALNNFQFTGEDAFADKDVCSIALELPNSALGGGMGVNLWHRTLVPADGAGSGWVQADRGARPHQTPFLAGPDRDAYVGAEPAQDERFVATFAHGLEHAGGYTPEEARRVARTLLPDVLPYDPTRPAAYPANGRALTDDVPDVFYPLLTNGKATGHNAGPHTDLLAEFPYVGPPHTATATGGGSGYSPMT